jgi:hypothetical protein
MKANKALVLGYTISLLEDINNLSKQLGILERRFLELTPLIGELINGVETAEETNALAEMVKGVECLRRNND